MRKLRRFQRKIVLMLVFQCYLCHLDVNQNKPAMKGKMAVMIKQLQEADVLVVGAGFAGMNAAIEAADLGAKSYII